MPIVRLGKFSITSALVVLCGCATVIDQARLNTPSPHAIVFNTPFTYSTSAESDLPRPEPGAFRGVLAGTYVAVYEDDHGIYYRAPGRCIISMTYPSKGKKYLVEGGIWIEKNSVSPKFRLYRIAGLGVGEPSPIGDLPPCSINSNAVENQGKSAEALNQLVIQSAVAPPVPAGPIAAGVGSAIAYTLVGAMIESEKGKIILYPSPVDAPGIAGAYSKQDMGKGL
ncbi:hypothetical protein [Pandoraea communis]|uniref:hypothetical protein n=1 Tax=Pandoraea communis TaxID=2508297 RepID=UPI0025A63A63|nr:hypothetical protein [Pandoraea communis]MDM8359008.1 hypothetical protein [Pandoraea communis]